MGNWGYNPPSRLLVGSFTRPMKFESHPLFVILRYILFIWVINTYFGCGPLPVTVTTRIITCFVGDFYKPSCAMICTLLLGGGHTQDILYHLRVIHKSPTSYNDIGSITGKTGTWFVKALISVHDCNIFQKQVWIKSSNIEGGIWKSMFQKMTHKL